MANAADESSKSSPPIHILGICGSLRRGSYNRALLLGAQDIVPPGVTLELFDIAAIPFFNADVEAEGDPAPVAIFKEALRAADALLIATPEYNHGVPGVLKNALDWASRPHRASPLDCKPAAIMGATAGRGSTFQAQAQLRSALVYSGTCTLAQPELSLSQAAGAFDDSGRLQDDDTRDALRELMEAFVEWVRVIHSGEGKQYQARHAHLMPAIGEIAPAV